MLSQLFPSIRATLVLAIFTGLLFPAVIYAVAQVTFPWQANGSLLKSPDGKTIIGSALIGQRFSRPEYFHPRPSAAGSGYAGEASGGTNLGPTSAKLINGDGSFKGISQLAVEYRLENGLAPQTKVPVDAVTRSASGLDPDISPMNAAFQCQRVARARQITPQAVMDLIRRNTDDPQLGIFGEARVNVLQLNIALDRLTNKKEAVVKL